MKSKTGTLILKDLVESRPLNPINKINKTEKRSYYNKRCQQKILLISKVYKKRISKACIRI
jgi:hypothetical protein